MRKRHTSVEFITRATKVHGDRYDYSRINYIGNEIKVELVCKKHGVFFQRPGNHLSGRGCPTCSKRRISECNKRRKSKVKTLASDKKIASEFHPNLNGGEKPENFCLNSKIKIWWKCLNGHAWRSCIGDRTKSKSGCPFCANKKATPEHNLSLFTELVKEINPTLNGNIDPTKILPRSSKKIWWLCKNGHSWKALISSRTDPIEPRGCPFCRVGKQISFLELRVFIELKKIFPNTTPKEKSLGCECDVFIPEFNLVIEIDGHYWHKDREKEDIKKTETVRSNGRDIIHIREYPLNLLTKNDIVYKKREPHLNVIKNLFKGINTLLGTNLEINSLDEKEYKNNLYICYPKFSLYKNYPELIKEWNVEKNGLLTPEKISKSSGIKVWWKCSKGHEWEAPPHNRVRGAGCPFCSGRFSTMERSLLVLFPEIAKEWDFELNKDLNIENISYGSGKRVGWVCKNCGNKWFSRVSDRTRGYSKGHSCPKCFKNKGGVNA